MKKIVLLSLIALFSFQANAQIKSTLTIFSRDGEKFWIVRNGVKQNDVPSTSVTMEGITDRSFKIKVLIDDDKLTTVDQNIYTIDVDEKVCDLTYELRKNNKNKYSLRMISFVLAANKPTSNTQKPVEETPMQEIQVEMPQVTNTNVQVSVSGSGFMSNGSMCDAPTMNPKVYLDFRYEIEAQNIYRREEYVKNIISKNCMLSEQIAGIINLKYATVDELNIAKHAYRYTFDTENYGLVINAIKSETKKRDLLTFLNVSQGAVQTTTSTTTNNENLNIQVNDPNLGVNFNVNVPNANVTTTTTTSQTVDRNTDRQNKRNDKPRSTVKYDNNCLGAMPSVDFNQAIALIKKSSFADDKMKVAQQVTRNNCLSVPQIVEICKLFSFEDNKLEFAKFAYDFTIEKNKYYLVNEVFSFSSSRDEMDSFIQNK